MSCNLVSTINGNECIGDSRDKINSNFAALQSVVCSLSTNTIYENDSTTIDLTFTPSTRNLIAGVKPDSLDSTHLKDNSVGTSELSAQAVTTDKIALSAITAEKMSGGQTGSAPVFGARAWVNFDGTGAIGSPQTIRASGNVSSVVKNGNGNYTINFTVPMPDTNYVWSINGRGAAGAGVYGFSNGDLAAPTTSDFTFYTVVQSGAPTNHSVITVTIFR